MLMPRRLESHLNVKHIPYSMIFHAAADSAQMAASAMHLPGKEVAKAVALQAGNREILAVLPASYRINFQKLSAIVGATVRLMDEEAVSELFPDCERGVIPPFGELYGVPVYLGEALAEDPEIILSAGTHSDCRAHGRMWISSTLPSLASARLPRNASHSLHLAPSVLQHFAGCAGAARDADFLVPLVTCRKRLS